MKEDYEEISLGLIELKLRRCHIRYEYLLYKITFFHESAIYDSYQIIRKIGTMYLIEI